jgi:hypothetical protein
MEVTKKIEDAFKVLITYEAKRETHIEKITFVEGFWSDLYFKKMAYLSSSDAFECLYKRDGDKELYFLVIDSPLYDILLTENIITLDQFLAYEATEDEPVPQPLKELISEYENITRELKLYLKLGG